MAFDLNLALWLHREQDVMGSTDEVANVITKYSNGDL
jgi:hypothetical protein